MQLKARKETKVVGILLLVAYIYIYIYIYTYIEQLERGITSKIYIYIYILNQD